MHFQIDQASHLFDALEMSMSRFVFASYNGLFVVSLKNALSSMLDDNNEMVTPAERVY